MAPEDILAHKPRVLSQAQREHYFATGSLAAAGVIPNDWLQRLIDRSRAFIEISRARIKSDEEFDLGLQHSAATPHVRRLRALVDRHPDFWAFARESPLADIAADLVGPDVKFHSSKLNYKWPGTGEVVKWHQDIPAWPHTNYTPCTAGTYIHDCNREQGPMGFIPGSHNGPIYSEYDADGRWTGCLTKDDAATLDLSKVVWLEAPAGSITIHNCRSLHYSEPNNSPIARPLLLNVYSNANAMPYTANPIPSQHSGAIVRGKPAKWAHHDARPCLLPPNWAATGYSSIFAKQQGEDKTAIAPDAMM